MLCFWIRHLIRAYVAKRYFEDYRCTDNRFILVLVTNGNIIGNSQNAKQMKKFLLKYVITVKRLKYSQRNLKLQFCWVIHTSLHGSLHDL